VTAWATATELKRPASDPCFTIGHSTRTLAGIVAPLQQADVTLLVDVRLIPLSRTIPQFNQDALAGALTAAGIGHRRLASLLARRNAILGIIVVIAAVELARGV